MQVSQKAGKVVWYSHLLKNFPEFVVIHTVKSFNVLNKAQVGALWNSLAFSMSHECWKFDLWFFCVSQSSLYIWKFSVCILLKPNLKDFEPNLADVWKWMQLYGNLNFLWLCLSLRLEWNRPFLVRWPLLSWDWNETDLFQSGGHCWVFQICEHIECSTLTASSFRILNSSTGIPSPPLAFLVVNAS